MCSDAEEFSSTDAVCAARHVADAQHAQLSSALGRVLDRMCGDCRRVLICGSGAFLAERVGGGEFRLRGVPAIRLNEVFDRSVSEAACAFAVARLAAERLGH